MIFFPKNVDFFNRFEAQIEKLQETATLLESLEASSNLKATARDMKRIEKEADALIRDVLEALNKTFITPIDREDITELASALDDVVDTAERFTSRLEIYQISPLPRELFQYLRFLGKAIDEVNEAVRELRDPKRRAHVLKHCEVINLLENQLDDLHRHTLRDLFAEEKDPIILMKRKEIYEILEDLADRCEDVANVLETIVVKNA